MAEKLRNITVKKLHKSTSDCTIVTFDIDEDKKDIFDYKQGQYLTLEADIQDEKVRRSYSLCTSPLDAEWSVAVKKVPGGKFSTFVNEELKAGDTLKVMPPEGKFFIELNPDKKKEYVAFAAGSGITPIMSLIKTHLAVEPESRFQLFYVNQYVSSIILKEELEGLKNRYMDRLEIYHFLTRQDRDMPLFNGRIDQEKLDAITEDLMDIDEVDDIFICGPEEMIFTIKDYFTDKGMDKEKIHFELFGTGKKYKTKRQVVVDPTVISHIEIKEGGKTLKFDIPKGSDNILDAALKHNADLPFACKGGVCCTCRAKLIDGEVEMEVAYGLEPEEIAAGYILTCQAVPKSDNIIVDFEG